MGNLWSAEKKYELKQKDRRDELAKILNLPNNIVAESNGLPLIVYTFSKFYINPNVIYPIKNCTLCSYIGSGYDAIFNMTDLTTSIKNITIYYRLCHKCRNKNRLCKKCYFFTEECRMYSKIRITTWLSLKPHFPKDILKIIISKI
jgi:hypothetical protein